MPDRPDPDSDQDDRGQDEPSQPFTQSRLKVRIVVRLVVVVAAIGAASVALAAIFEDLDIREISDALSRLSDAEWIALFMSWLMWIGTQGLQTSSLVAGLPARRGVLAFLAPTAIASVIPGPSDLPVKYSMYQSWGSTPADAARAVAASGIFSVGSQLILPALAGVTISLGGAQIEGFMSVVVAASVLLAFLIVAFAIAVGSEKRARWAGDLVDPIWRRMRPDHAPATGLGELVVAQRSESISYLGDKWLAATAATCLTIAARCCLLIMTLRFVGIPEEDLGWSAIFVVFALVAGLTIVPITPGSAGVADVALVAMLAPIAGNAYVNEVAAGVLLYRLMTWILIIPIGLASLGVWRMGLRRQPVDGPDSQPNSL